MGKKRINSFLGNSMLDDIIGTDVLLNVGSRDANGDSLVEYKSCHVEYEIGLNPPEQQKLYKVRLKDGSLTGAWRCQLFVATVKP